MPTEFIGIKVLFTTNLNQLRNRKYFQFKLIYANQI